ncbi:MAG: hypothetical protein WCR36_05565 [Bacteroidaceae bacterium]
MKQTIQNEIQVKDAIHKIIKSYGTRALGIEATTDIYIRIDNENENQLLFLDDDSNILAKCSTPVNEFEDLSELMEPLTTIISDLDKEDAFKDVRILTPFSFLLDDDKDIYDLYVVDDDTLVLNQTLLEGLEDDLTSFLKDLLDD